MSTETKPPIKRTRKTPDLKAAELIAAFDKLPYDEKVKVLTANNATVSKEKAQLIAAAQATLDKLK